VGDWVLKRKPNTITIMVRSNRLGSFYLADSKCHELQHSWNVDSLKKYYI
jgi:hypothetical protein